MFTSAVRPYLLLVVVLAIQNIAIFYNHYFFGFAFPWDFLITYHAVPYYWIEAAKHGIDFQWIPFQGMGYPIYMNLQSGVFYPPFWLFVLLNKSYTLSAAVFMQGMHILFGAIGATICARAMGLKWSSAILAGTFYQGFGAFYSNSEHPDIVRTYSLLPWLCAPIFASWKEWSNLLGTLIVSLPIIVYCMWTGGYPGGALATLFVLGTIALLRTAIEQNSRRVGFFILLSILAGCLLSGISLVPALMTSKEIVRSGQVQAMAYDYLLAKDFFSLIYDIENPYFSHDVSMRSMFIGIPAVALLFYGLDQALKWNRWVVLSIVLSLAVASGLLHKLLIIMIPPLGYSRFTLADYRGFIGFGLVLLAAQSAEIKSPKQYGCIWAVALAFLVIIGNFKLGLNRQENGLDVKYIMLVLFAVLIALGPVLTKYKRFLIPFLILIAFADWERVHSLDSYFNVPNGDSYITSVIGNPEDSKQKLLSEMEGRNGCRPMRIAIPASELQNKPWRGYYTGDFMMEDYAGPMRFVRQTQILTSPLARRFAQEPWKAVDIEQSVKVQEGLFGNAASGSIRCARYSTSQIVFDVTASQPQSVVENELYWKGWTAQIVDGAGHFNRTLIPTDVNGFRSWNLPAGNYKLVASFEVPYKQFAAAISGIGLLLWLTSGYFLFRKRRKKT